VSENSHGYLLLLFWHSMIILYIKICMFITHMEYIFNYREVYYVKMSNNNACFIGGKDTSVSPRLSEQ
jgi:hypothetical protein